MSLASMPEELLRIIDSHLDSTSRFNFQLALGRYGPLPYKRVFLDYWTSLTRDLDRYVNDHLSRECLVVLSSSSLPLVFGISESETNVKGFAINLMLQSGLCWVSVTFYTCDDDIDVANDVYLKKMFIPRYERRLSFDNGESINMKLTISVRRDRTHFISDKKYSLCYKIFHATYCPDRNNQLFAKWKVRWFYQDRKFVVGNLWDARRLFRSILNHLVSNRPLTVDTSVRDYEHHFNVIKQILQRIAFIDELYKISDVTFAEKPQELRMSICRYAVHVCLYHGERKGFSARMKYWSDLRFYQRSRRCKCSNYVI